MKRGSTVQWGTHYNKPHGLGPGTSAPAILRRGVPLGGWGFGTRDGDPQTGDPLEQAKDTKGTEEAEDREAGQVWRSLGDAGDEDNDKVKDVPGGSPEFQGACAIKVDDELSDEDTREHQVDCLR